MDLENIGLELSYAKEIKVLGHTFQAIVTYEGFPEGQYRGISSR